MLYSLIVVGVVVLSLSLLLIFKNKIPASIIDKGVKIASIVLFSLGILRMFINDNFIWVINGGTYGVDANGIPIYYKEIDILQSILRWGHYLSYVVIPCAAFFTKRIYKNVTVYFCTIITILQLIFFKDTTTYFLIDSERAIYLLPIIRYMEYALELILALLIPLVIRFIQGHKFDYKNKKEWINFFILLPVMLLICVPVYLPQSLFGFTEIEMGPLSWTNILWIVLVLAFIAILYFSLRYKDYETRYSTLIFISLLLFLHYNSIYLMDLVASRLPLQLCNLGAYLILIAFLIKKQAFFDFVLLANVPGAAIALVAVDVSQPILSFWNIHFYIEHTWVFVLPIVAVALRIFKRPGKAAFKHFIIGFSTYFLICAIGGLIINCALYEEYHWFFNKVNYFYMFEIDLIGAIPFLKFLYKWEVSLGGYIFYPLFMLLVYCFFVVFCLIFNYVYLYLVKTGDDHYRLRQIKIDMRNEKGYYERKKKKMPQYDYEENLEGEVVC